MILYVFMLIGVSCFGFLASWVLLFVVLFAGGGMPDTARQLDTEPGFAPLGDAGRGTCIHIYIGTPSNRGPGVKDNSQYF
jgi:hypothetical protein